VHQVIERGHTKAKGAPSGRGRTIAGKGVHLAREAKIFNQKASKERGHIPRGAQIPRSVQIPRRTPKPSSSGVGYCIRFFLCISLLYFCFKSP
jgi:hypothetical protein